MSTNPYQGKNVLITGHTGFKGAWLSLWLKKLGANLTGISLDPITHPSLYTLTNHIPISSDYRLDLGDCDSVSSVIKSCKPDFIFHLAAQAIVRESYINPLDTWKTNLLGTVNVLEALRTVDWPCSVVFVTSDKCYENMEWSWGYRENDVLGGIDPYSASKASAEIAIRSYYKSFFSDFASPVKIASARAGNVIGGGDWSMNRIVPDCIRKWSSGDTVYLRNPQATRPWQHVLEPLGGYLTLASKLSEPTLSGLAFNFGPEVYSNKTVLSLVQELSKNWPQSQWSVQSDLSAPHECGLLSLNCDLAKHILGWRPVFSFEEGIQATAEWYFNFYNDEKFNPVHAALDQISNYSRIASERNSLWPFPT